MSPSEALGIGFGGESEADAGSLSRLASSSNKAASEGEYHLLLAEDLQFLTADEFNDVEGKGLEVERVLASLLRPPQSPI